MDGRSLKVLGVSGSLRRDSYNTAVLRAAQELVPPGMVIETFDLAPIPLYNEDVRSAGFPPPVEDFRARIKAADAVLFVSPEYNYSIPGVLKNAIDWASRPPDQPFDGKPIAILGASPGALGTGRMQYHLRQVLVGLNGLLLAKPEVLIAGAADKFDEQGRLKDEKTREHVGKQLAALQAWVERLRP